MRKVFLVNVTESGSYYADEHTSGAMVNITLQRGNEQVTCNDILVWDEEDVVDNDTFGEWKQMAEDGVEGYSLRTV